jgi:phage shock protein A
MGLWNRISRAVRASITEWIQATEDPEKLLDQAVADMQGDLIQLRQAVAQAIATQKRTERQRDQAQQLAQEYYNRANLALQAGDEPRAREALAQRQSFLQTVQTLEGHLQQQAGVVGQMKDTMRALERKIMDARTRRDMYIARARSAAASQRLNEMMGQFGSDGSQMAFDRMENRVLELEAQSAAIADLNATMQDGRLENRFAALEAGGETAVETELAALKAGLQPPPEG